MRVGLLAAQLGEDLVQLVLVVGLVRRRPVVEVVLAGHAVTVSGSSGVVAQATETTHDSSQPLVLIQRVPLPLQQAQPLSGPVKALLVVALCEAQALVLCCGAKVAQADGTGIVNVDVVVVVGVVGLGAQRGRQIEDVFVDRASELVEGGDERGRLFRVLYTRATSVSSSSAMFAGR